MAQGNEEEGLKILNNGMKLLLISSIVVIGLSTTVGFMLIDLQARGNQNPNVVRDAKTLIIFKSLA
jgi:uncharacterized membrane protein